MKHKMLGANKRPQVCNGGATLKLAAAPKKPRDGLYIYEFRRSLFLAADRILHPQLRPKP